MEVVGAIFMAVFGAVGMYIYMRVRELCECKNNALAASTANAVVSQLQTFSMNHWTPTKTTTPAA